MKVSSISNANYGYKPSFKNQDKTEVKVSASEQEAKFVVARTKKLASEAFWVATGITLAYFAVKKKLSNSTAPSKAKQAFDKLMDKKP